MAGKMLSWRRAQKGHSRSSKPTMMTGAVAGPPREGRPSAEIMVRGSEARSNLENCARVLPSLERRKLTGLEVLPSAAKLTEMLSKPGTSEGWRAPMTTVEPGGRLAFWRRRTSTRCCSAGESCWPVADACAGVCAWQPRVARVRARRVAAREDGRKRTYSLSQRGSGAALGEGRWGG